MQCWVWRAVAALLGLRTGLTQIDYRAETGHSCLFSISQMVTQKKDVMEYGYVHHDTDSDDDDTAQDFLETGSEADTDDEEYDDRIKDHNV